MKKITLSRQARSGHTRQLLPIRTKLMWGFGSGGDFAPEKIGADWEYADGTSAPRTAAHSHVEKNLRTYMESVIDACATVEEMAERNQLPSRPGSDLIRKYDPEVPLYLPMDDVVIDSSSTTAQKYEAYGEAAPYYSEQEVDLSQGVNRQTAGDGTPLDDGTQSETQVSKTKKGRRRKVVTIKQHWRHTQPMAGSKAGPFNASDIGRFGPGHGTAT